MVNLNVTWLGFVFILISFVHMHDAVVVPQSAGEGGGVGRWIRLKLDVQGQGGGNILNVDGHGGWGS